MAQWNRDTQNFLGKDTTWPGREDFQGVVIADRFGAITDWRPDFTSKNRLKTSGVQTIFWNSFSAFADNDTFQTTRTGGGEAYINNNAAVPESFDPTNPGSDIIVEKSVIMRVTSIGDKVVRQSRRVIPYIPGKEQFASMAIRFEPRTVGIRRRIGTFDDQNGMYFEDSGDNYFCCIRKNGVETIRISRENWNGDKLDGTGRSGITFDFAKQQLLCIEYEWYGTGMTRFGFAIDNELHIIHTVYNANNTQGTWTKTPNLPVRFELEALPEYTDNIDHYLFQSSTSVVAEGGVEELGVLNNSLSAINTSTNPPTMTVGSGNLAVANTFYPLLSIRLKAAALDSYVAPQAFQVFTEDDSGVYFVVVRNGTLTGATFGILDADWVGAELDDAATSIDFGRDDIIYSGYFAGGAAPINMPISAQLQLGRVFTNPGSPDFADLTSDVYTICAASKVGGKTGFASITWLEQP